VDLCVACGKDCEVTEFDPKNWYRIDWKTFCVFKIHRVAIKRIRENEHERNRFLLRLESAYKDERILRVSYQPSGEKPTLKFSDDPRT
jgi:hypothetical protein